MFTKQLFLTAICSLLFVYGCSSNQTAKKKPLPAVKTKDPIATLDGNVAMAFSPDGKWLAIGAELVDTSTWKVTAMLEERLSDKNPKSKNHWGYTSIAFSPDSKQVALGDQDGTLRLLEVPSMKLKKEVLTHGARITGIGFSNDNETIVTTSVDDAIRIGIWNSKTDKLVFRSASDKAAKDEGTVSVDVVGAVDVFALSPNRELFAVADVMSKIVVGSVSDGKILHEFKGPNGDKVEMDSLAFSADSSQLLIGVTPEVHVYKLNGEATNITIQTKSNAEPVQVKLVNENGLAALWYVDVNSMMPIVELYDLAQTKSLGTFLPDQSRGAFWSVSPNGQFIATSAKGGPIRIWNVQQTLADLPKL